MLNLDQVLAAQKTSFGNFFGGSAKVFEGYEKLVALNLQTGKALLAETEEKTQALFAAKVPQDLIAVQASAFQPSFDKVSSYVREVYDIVSAANAELGLLAESAAADFQKAIAVMFEGVLANAPAGSENVFNFVKSAMAAANGAYDSANQVAQRAAEYTESNIQTVADATAKAVTPRTKRAA